MTERDAFEVRFGAAVRGYSGRVSSDLDPVQLAHRIATKEPRRRGLAEALRWRGLAIPRLAWVLLLLAALLAAMVAGMLAAGSQRPASGFACPPGATPDKPGPVDQARPAEPSTMAFDRRAGRLVALAGAGDDVETWTFDVCTNTWTQMHPNREPPQSEWNRLVYDVGSDLTIGVLYTRAEAANAEPGKVWAYDLQADTWTEKGVAPTDARPWAYDPVSGLVVAAALTDHTELWNYDVETDTWTPIPGANGPEAYAVVAYDASVDRIIAHIQFGYGGPVTWLFDIRTGTWSRSGAETPDLIVGMYSPTIAYDEAAERTVIIGGLGLAAYDATADCWEILVDNPDPSVWMPALMEYDPVNGRLVGLGRGAIVDEGGVVAFDVATRQWTVLLEPSEGQPAPSSK